MITVIRTFTRADANTPFDVWPDDQTRIWSEENAPVSKAISQEESFSLDDLTFTLTLVYDNLDDYLIEDEESSERRSKWDGINSWRYSVHNITRSRQVYDANNSLISEESIANRITGLKAEGKISA